MSDFIAGFQAKATIDGATYAFATYRVRAAGMQHDVSNTEGYAGNNTIAVSQLGVVAGIVGTSAPVFESRLPGLIHLEATIRQATFDADNSPFIAPVSLAVNFYYAISILYTATGPAWSATSFLVNDIDGDGDVRGLQPISFSGMSDGEFFLPGQSEDA